MNRRKQAGSGGAGGVFVLLLIALAMWFVWPSLEAAREALVGQAAGMGRQAVNEVRPVIIVTAVVPETAVGPETAVSLPDLAATVSAMAVPETAVPVATIAPVFIDLAQPAPTAVPMADNEFLQACADGQAAGRRVSPRCPADAAAVLASGQGQGR